MPVLVPGCLSLLPCWVLQHLAVAELHVTPSVAMPWTLAVLNQVATRVPLPP